MAISTERQKKVDAMRVLIRAGYSDMEIHKELSDRYELTPAMLVCQRRHEGISNPQREEACSLQTGKPGYRWNGRCPKCGGIVINGGTRFGVPAPDIQSCLNCGLTNESISYYDADLGSRVEM